ncbi:hypothetical protein B0H34DRAFT_694128 [Crassisporium funariophilum]|nr:hypothetical protein B0H34DRAFT_694128 [Crassisporium funariophilum]
MPDDPSTNALGLDFSQLTVQPSLDTPDAQPSSSTQPPSPTVRKLEKEKPYVNTERVKTGGTQRDKLSDEALQERMARMREQNEKIKQRRLDVQADEDAFKKTQESERVKQALSRKVQANIDRARDQNAKRKMDKVQSREWDSGKPAADRHTSQTNRPQAAASSAVPVTAPGQEGTSDPQPSSTVTAPESAADTGGWTRGTHVPNARGRGRGRGAPNRGGPRRDAGKPTEPTNAESSKSEGLPPAATT